MGLKSFNYLEFQRSRKAKRGWGISLFWSAFILTVIDLTLAFPTPNRGRFIPFALILAGIGAVLYILSKKLPLEEVLLIGSDKTKYPDGIMISDLVSELRITTENAEEILTALEKKGFATVKKVKGSRIWTFKN
jgi:hypothetical protein